MTSLLAVHGVRLDRAWPKLGSMLGEMLREWSAALLAEVGQVVARTGADQLLFVGDLLDRAMVTPATVEYAGAVLGAVGVPVTVVPGRSDWYGEGSPYVHAFWPANVSIVSSSIPMAFGSGELVWGSAWTGPAERGQGLPSQLGAARTGLLVRPDVLDPAAMATRLPKAVRLLTSSEHPATDGPAIVLPPLASPGSGAAARLLTLQANGAWEVEHVGLSRCPVAIEHIDVTGLTSEHDVRDAVFAAAADAPTVIRLSGTLAAGVLPLSLHAESLVPHVVIDEDDLEFPGPEVDNEDRTTRAEFLRAMAGLPAAPRLRHVATALGLQALEMAEA